MESSVLGETRRIAIPTPSGYEIDAAERYATVIVLDIPPPVPLPEPESSHATLIVVSVHAAGSRGRDLTPQSRNHREIEIVRRQSSCRAWTGAIAGFLSGDSFGGLFALHTLIHRPEVFSGIIAISPSLWWDDQGLTAPAQQLFDGIDVRRPMMGCSSSLAAGISTTR